MYLYYILYISEATVARLLRNLCAVDSTCITSYSETGVCVLLVLCTCVAVKECALFAIVR